MQIQWKKVKNEDGSEMLFGTFEVAALEEASRKADQAVQIIKSHREDKHSHMSLSSEGLVIALYGISRGYRPKACSAVC